MLSFVLCSGSQMREAGPPEQPAANGSTEESAEGQTSAGPNRKRDAQGMAKSRIKDRTELSFRQRARMADLSLLLDVILKTTGSRCDGCCTIGHQCITHLQLMIVGNLLVSKC